jgi:hypothetical protein
LTGATTILKKKNLCKDMSNKNKYLYFGDTFNTLGCEDHHFQWSQTYKWYLSLTLPEKELKKIWSLGIFLVGCVPEVAEFKEMVLWCVDKFDTERRIVQIQGNLLIYLSPSMFRRML